MEALTPFVALGCIGAWITSVFVAISTHAWVLLLVDVIAFPIGIIHGVMVWLGFA